MKLLFLMLFSSCMNNDPIFYNKVLNDFDRYSWFITIEVKSSEYSGKSIIENDDLFYYLSQTQKIDKEEYKKIIKEKLENNSSIEIENIAKWNFIKVPTNETINQNAKKGVEEFIKIYFDSKVLKDGITDDERAVIIEKLFKWKIPTKIDDETGYLILSR